jgi:hypothetical protein
LALVQCRAVPRRSEAKAGVQFVSEPESCHGAGFLLRADARVRVQQPLLICLESRSKSKKCDKQLTHIVRVISRHILLWTNQISIPGTYNF